MRNFLPILLVVLLAACGAPAAQVPTDAPAPTVVPPTAAPPTEAPPTAVPPTEAPTAVAVVPPTVEPTVVPTAAPTTVLYKGAVEGRDAAGAFTLGDPAAPLVLTDYSDFL